MSICNICPRNCNIDRSVKTGYCSMTDKVKISRAALHMWEEPCISGERGSGTVFFSGCNMKCVFCQNKDISHEGFGKEITVEHLADIIFKTGKSRGFKHKSCDPHTLYTANNTGGKACKGKGAYTADFVQHKQLRKSRNHKNVSRHCGYLPAGLQVF